jgi:DNA-binding winged helix-turn-helix (wHTH) protein
MRASGSTTALRRLPWLQASPLTQFPPEARPAVRRVIRNPGMHKPFFGRAELGGARSTEISFGTFCLLPAQFLLLEGDKPVPLGSRALQILVALLDRAGELVTKEELMGLVWPNVFVEPANLTVHISALRRALRDGREGNRFIINIPGRGYRFVASVQVSMRET